MRKAAADCRGCPLHVRATQVVFGEGPTQARVVLVGEQPGDAEDRAGRPFVGPAGRTLDRALEDAGFERSEVYVTNAVKHFYFEERGKARIHKKPRPGDVRACRPWLDAEIETVSPDLIVLLGATAVASRLGPEVRLSRERGKVLSDPSGAALVLTAHPSVVRRAPTSEARHQAYAALVADLKVARAALDERRPR